MWRKLIGIIGIGLGLALLGMSIFWGAASAQGFRSGTTATVGSGEVVDSTLWISGRTVDISGQVNGDVFCAGQNVTISGTVRGDVLCAAQNITVNGVVTGNVRALSQTITVAGTVAHNVSVATQSYNQSTKGIVRGDISVAAGDATINGTVGRDAALASQTIHLDGSVGRNVMASVSNLNLSSTADIKGNLNYTSQNTAQIASGAVIGGQTTKSMPTASKTTVSLAPLHLTAWFAFYVLVAGLLTAIVLVLLFPQAIRAVTDRGVGSFWKSLLVGLIASIVVPAVIVFLFVTVIGIPLALILLLAWLLIQVLAGVVSAYYLGRQILRRQRNSILVMLVGAVVLIILYFIPVIGFIALILASLLGVGMILLELFRRRSPIKYTTNH